MTDVKIQNKKEEKKNNQPKQESLNEEADKKDLPCSRFVDRDE